MKEYLEGEIWKDIEGYEGLYQVSNLGRVKSLPRKGVGKNERILKQIDNTGGYLTVTIYLNKKGKIRRVHKLVAEAFLNHKPNGMNLVVDHINDIKIDNRVENLQIVTTRFNAFKTQGKYSSKYKGVNWNNLKNKWQSRILIGGKRKHLGYYDCELKAHLAYQNALKEIQYATL